MSMGWGDTVTVTLYHELEDEDFEGGYEVVTMTGVPEKVQITGTDPHSAEGALDHLTRGLRALGFGGRLLVDDVTRPGRNDQYEITV